MAHFEVARLTHYARIPYVCAAVFVTLILYTLYGIGDGARAATSNVNVFTTVSAGVLDFVSASSSQSFTGVTVDFTAQTATMPDLGAIRLKDARGSGAGWSLTLAGQDWNELNNSAAGGRHNQLDYDGTGSNDNLGKMCIIVSSGAITSAAGQSTSGITKGSLACFSASVTSLSIYTASATNGKGNYWITDFALQQYIPSNPTAQNLTTTLTLTLS